MYIADLHIHSRYSRATSKDCTPEYLDLWARKKGIGILGTGDFTHPAWREELKEKLAPAEEGLYVLKDEYRLEPEKTYGMMAPRFVISGEISSIYKKNERVRKVHSVILLPGLEEAELVAKKLETIGNVHSDGRPILGLDCHDLLEIALELCPRAIYIPAHIWTPHFSLFGAFSGFDTIEECFGDLTPHIHALETGLSSDPPMNWRLSALDRFQLVSNSDAHSPKKLGREANLMEIDLSYTGLYDAIQHGKGLHGTIEFFPEEGKYHFDGHRKCHLCLSPLEAEKYNGKCPVCGKKLTIGVSHRVEQLADREEGFVLPNARAFESLVPLPEVIGASTGHSPASVKVQKQYEDMMKKLGPEFHILRDIPVEEIRSHSGYLISEGIRRLREGKVDLNPGYDGEYGTVKLFDQLEIDNLDGQLCLFTGAQMEKLAGDKKSRETGKIQSAEERTKDRETVPSEQDEKSNQPQLNEGQAQAATAAARAVAVIAGPGTGKTVTLVSRALSLLNERKVRASEITAVTFTRKAAMEMRSRLEQQAGGKRVINRMNIGTFHSICYELLKKQGISFQLADETELYDWAAEVVREHGLKLRPKEFLRKVSMKKNGMLLEADLEPELLNAMEHYGKRLSEEGILDYDDILLKTLELLKEEKKNQVRKQNFPYLLVDEFQDINQVQYQLIKAWNQGGRELFVIGDPDQAIYSFRGSDSSCFERLKKDFVQLLTVRLEKNYRSAPSVIGLALSVIDKNQGMERTLVPVAKKDMKVRLVIAASELSEDIFAAKEINRLIGGIDMLDAQGHEEKNRERHVRSFGDIAILYRTHRQAELLEKCLGREGIPYVVAGREEFLEADVVRGTICFFKYLFNKEDSSARRVSLKLLWKLSEEEIGNAPVSEMISKYQPKLKKEKPEKLLEEWMEDMGLTASKPMEKFKSMSLFYKNMEEFLTAIAFGGESDLKRCGTKTYTSDAVTLMTLHGAKGLEFPVVMICGVKKGKIPLENEKQDVDIEEERRLFYVGMTRAREELILCTSPESSSFLQDIPEEYLTREITGKQKISDGGTQMSLFDFM